MTERKGNPPIPMRPCFKCGKPTNETHSVHGVGHYKCFMSPPRDNRTHNKAS